jgi:hypothetical protein
MLRELDSLAHTTLTLHKPTHSLPVWLLQEDPFNAIMAGAATGGFLQLRAGLRPAFRSAVVGGVLLVSGGWWQPTITHLTPELRTDKCFFHSVEMSQACSYSAWLRLHCQPKVPSLCLETLSPALSRPLCVPTAICAPLVRQ